MSQTLLQYETVKDIFRRFQVRKGTMREILDISESTQARYERKMQFSIPRSLTVWNGFNGLPNKP
jgi:hypothetical protein